MKSAYFSICVEILQYFLSSSTLFFPHLHFDIFFAVLVVTLSTSSIFTRLLQSFLLLSDRSNLLFLLPLYVQHLCFLLSLSLSLSSHSPSFILIERVLRRKMKRRERARERERKHAEPVGYSRASPVRKSFFSNIEILFRTRNIASLQSRVFLPKLIRYIKVPLEPSD